MLISVSHVFFNSNILSLKVGGKFNLKYFWISPTALFFLLFSPWRYDHLSGCSGACLDTFVMTPMITLGLHCYISAMIEMWKSLVPSLGVDWIFSSTCVYPFWDLWVLPESCLHVSFSPSINIILCSQLQEFVEGSHEPFLKSLGFWKQSRKPCNKSHGSAWRDAKKK